MGGHLLHIYNSSQPYRMKRLTAYLPMSVRRYSQGNKGHHEEHGPEEKAPSTAEEFRRMAEEKTRQGFVSHTSEKAQDAPEEARRVAEAKTRQGFVSHTSEKTQEALEEAIIGESSFEPVKERFKEPPAVGNFHKIGDERQPQKKK